MISTLQRALPTLLLPLTLALAAQDPAAEAPKSPTEVYHKLHADGDAAGMVAYWRANEAQVLYTIDADLEGSLGLWESARDPETGAVELTEETAARIALHQERALFGARAASEAFGRPIFHDYAAAFVSWGPAEKASFRAGQAAFGEAIAALGAKDTEAAVAAAERCTALAEPLGDWWGASMGLGISGAAKLEEGRLEDALADLARARLLDQALGLSRSEKRNLDGMLVACVELGRTARAIACCEALVALTTGPEQVPYVERLEALRAGRSER